MPDPITVTTASPVEQLHAAFARVCERLGCTDGDVTIQYDIVRLRWVAWHGQRSRPFDNLATTSGVDQLRSWFLALHEPLLARLPTIDGRWPVRQVDPLWGG